MMAKRLIYEEHFIEKLVDFQAELGELQAVGLKTIGQALKECPTIEPEQAAWINVQDEPPELGRRVMTCGRLGGIGIGRRHYDDLDNVITMESSHADRGFLYWRPLPSLPAGMGGDGKK
jgi:hypothetical protein